MYRRRRRQGIRSMRRITMRKKERKWKRDVTRGGKEVEWEGRRERRE